MFALKNRLKNEKDINTLLARGRSVFDMALGLKLVPNHLPNTRFAISAGIKVSKNAVDRNRIKRRVRAVLEKRISIIKPGFDVLILTKKEALPLKYKEIESQIERLLKRSGLL